MPDVAHTPSSAAQKPAIASTGLVDLEKELSCSICTDILYQPLTLLDCLHTFCGSCLKEWFSWQRQRADQEHERIQHTRPQRRPRPYAYTCPSCRAVVRETRPNATVTTLLDMYLSANPDRQKGDAEKQEISNVYRPGDAVLIQSLQLQGQGPADSNADTTDLTEEEDRQFLEHVQQVSLRELASANYNVRHTRARRHHEQASRGNAHLRRGRHRDAVHNHAPSRQLQLGHQSSLRSLLSPYDSEEMKEEILRQIAEEGLLDDIDWDHIQVEQEDEISERIAEAYRRRRRDRSGARTETSSNRVESQRQGENVREPTHSSFSHTETGHTRSSSASGSQANVNNLPPVSRPYLFSANNSDSSWRARSTSQGRLGTRRPSSSHKISTPAARSATDLSHRPRSRDSTSERRRRVSYEGRRSTDLNGTTVSEQWRNGSATSGVQHRATTQSTSCPPPPRTATSPPAAQGPVSSSSINVSCDRCGRRNIEHTLHYTCTRCGPPGSTYDLCLRCYRLGRGCMHWYGFGQAAWQRWERKALPGSEMPHVLRSQKYLSAHNLPSEFNPVYVDGPVLQLGVFCDICESNANSCYWHCAQCNDGEWGYCHRCVNQGRHCVHPLLPMSLQASAATSLTRPIPGDQSTALTPLMPLVPLILPTTCNVCQEAIPRTAQRLHCPDCSDGDFDLCMACYERTSSTPRTSSRKCQQGHRLLLVDFVVVNGVNDRAWRRVLDGQTGAWLPEGMVPPTQVNAQRAEAIWPWIPEDGVKDELGFPRGAAIDNIVSINEEFSFGIYCRTGGYFPSAYVRMI